MTWGTDVPEHDNSLKPLKQELLRLDILLRRKQVFWETSKGLLLVAATTAVLAGVLGFKLGQTPPAPIVIELKQP